MLTEIQMKESLKEHIAKQLNKLRIICLQMCKFWTASIVFFFFLI